MTVAQEKGGLPRPCQSYFQIMGRGKGSDEGQIQPARRGEKVSPVERAESVCLSIWVDPGAGRTVEVSLIVTGYDQSLLHSFEIEDHGGPDHAEGSLTTELIESLISAELVAAIRREML